MLLIHCRAVSRKVDEETLLYINYRCDRTLHIFRIHTEIYICYFTEKETWQFTSLLRIYWYLRGTTSLKFRFFFAFFDNLYL